MLDLGSKNPEILTSIPRLTMKWCESEAIAAVMQVLTFFFALENNSTTLRIRFVSIAVGNESDDNSYVAYDRGSQNRRLAKRGPRSSRFSKKGSAKQQVRKKEVREAASFQKGVRKAKSLGTSDIRCRL